MISHLPPPPAQPHPPCTIPSHTSLKAPFHHPLPHRNKYSNSEDLHHSISTSPPFSLTYLLLNPSPLPRPHPYRPSLLNTSALHPPPTPAQKIFTQGLTKSPIRLHNPLNPIITNPGHILHLHSPERKSYTPITHPFIPISIPGSTAGIHHLDLSSQPPLFPGAREGGSLSTKGAGLAWCVLGGGKGKMRQHDSTEQHTHSNSIDFPSLVLQIYQRNGVEALPQSLPKDFSGCGPFWVCGSCARQEGWSCALGEVRYSCDREVHLQCYNEVRVLARA